MLRFMLNPSFILLFLSLFLLSAISSPPPSLSISDGVEMVGAGPHDHEEVQVLPWRSMAEDGDAHDHQENTTLILARERTRREDIFRNSELYTGGWNISDSRYISSVLSTAVPFFGVAVGWFVFFGISLQIICLCYCCCPTQITYGYSKFAYALSLIFLILFTLAAIVGCVILYTSQGKFHRTNSDTLDYVVNQAELIAENLRNVSDYLDASKQIGLGDDVARLPLDIQKGIDNVKTKIRTAAANVSNKTEENSKEIQQGIDGMRLALIVLAAVMLLLTFLGFLFSILGIQCLVYFLVVVGGILVAGTFILCGAFLFLHNAIGDTCVAMDEWVLNPTAHTALDEILPCVENATAQESLIKTRNVTHELVQMVDLFITNVANGNSSPFNYNQSGPPMPFLCNPFETDLTVPRCAAGEVALENAIEAWKNYTCQVSSSGDCNTPGRITPSIYTQMAAAVNVTYALYHYGPFFEELEDCTFVRKTFADISNNFCPDLRRFTEWIYFGLVVVSVAVMLSLVFWVIYERELRHRRHTKHILTQNQRQLAIRRDSRMWPY